MRKFYLLFLSITIFTSSIIRIVSAYSKSITFTLVSLFFLSFISLGQTVRYVSTTGSDGSGDGTLAKPYQTILKGITAASTINGDTIKVATGTYTATATTTVSKSVVIIGTGATSADVILDRGTYASSAIYGFTVTISNVLIKNLKVTRFEAGITSTATTVTNLTLDNVQLIENYSAGFYSTASIDSLTIINSTLSYNGNKAGFTSTGTIKRGICLLNGTSYSKIKFDNNTIDYNGFVGIDISSVSTTTSIDGVTITNNKVRNNLDEQITTWLGTSNPLKKAILISNNTIVLSDTSRLGIELRNPAGSGQTSGTGSIVVSNNNISVVSHTGNIRDMAAIAVIRKKEGASAVGINDQPQGVVVSGNTINDFQNPKAGDAYGIVFGGTGHKAFGNIISNTQFSIQLQKGNTNYASNSSSPDSLTVINTAYFDRDNSKDACVEIGSNTITTSGAAQLTTATATISLTLPAITTANATLGITFCTLQQAIDFKATVAGNTITANAGTYDEQVTISKSITIDGLDSSNRIATFSGISGGSKGVFVVAAQNVTVKNFKFIVDQSKLYSAIITSGNASNLLITGNNILSDNPFNGVLLTPYGNRNGIWVTNSSNITVQSNTINALGEKFRAGLAAGSVSGLLVGGNNVSDGNNFLADINHDVIFTNYSGDYIVKNNMFKGGGVEVSISMGNGAVIVSNNTFDGTYCHSIPSPMARIFTNAFATRTINFSYNHFTNQKWSISFENTRNVVLDHNDITAVYDSFRLISVNTKLRQTARPATLETIDIKLTNNNLTGTAGLTAGIGIEFLNFDQRPPANNYVGGNYIIGELGNENNFNANIPTFVKVSNLDGDSTNTTEFLNLYPEYNGIQYFSKTAYWTRDIFARHNRYFVNGALKLASTFGEEDWNAVYQSIFDRQDDVNVGAVVLMPTWSGATSTDWSDSTNWSYKLVPIAGLDAVIFPQVNKPVLTVDAACDTIILSKSMTLTTGIHNLTVFGNIRSKGIIDATQGNIIIGGTSNQLLSGTMNVKNMTLNNAAGAYIAAGDSNTLTVSGIYTPAKGVLFTNDNMVLKSDSSGTASIGMGIVSGGYITGKVTVERYLSARKAWRFLSVPTNTTQTVKQTWQEGATGNTSNPVPGYGAQITGAGGTAAGFDLYSATPSMKTYNAATNTWSDIANTTTAIIQSTVGYMTFIRGDRTANAFNSVPTQTVLRTKGTVYTGDQNPIPVSANKFAAMGNPYASALDMRKINTTGLKEFFYLWDPKLGGNYGFGAYQTFYNDGNGNYEAIPGMGSYGSFGSPSNFIQSGQAFFIDGTEVDGSITFKENAKAGGSPMASARAATLFQAQLFTSLYGVNADSSTYMIDGVLSNYGNNYSNSVDNLDALKSTNVAENLSIKRANTLLVVERRQSITAKDTIFLNLTGVKVQKYRFEFKADQLGRQGITGFLIDNYLHTSTSLDLSGSTIASFTIENIPGSYAANRFSIVFAPSLVLPVTFTSVKAYQQNKDIAVEWKAENESNLKQYDVEKSVDGNHFTIANTTAARNAVVSNYNWLDVNPSEGNNYYRVRSTDINGKIAYSTVVKVYMGKETQRIFVYPNPVVNGTINVQLASQPSGVYGIRLMNKLSQVMISKQINHAEGSSTETIQISRYAPHGIYQLEVTRPDATNINITVIY